MNKCDREVRDPLDLLDEVESILKINCAPVTWPIGKGKNFKGVYHLLRDEVLLFEAGTEKIVLDLEVIKGLDNPRLDELFADEAAQLRMDIELVQGASHAFDLDEFLAGRLTPVFFGSAINNFGVREILDALLEWAPAPAGRDATVREVMPTEGKFSGFVFKIQANMDPKHRDRIAFLRVCSGKFERGMKMKHLRLNRDVAANSVVTFMSHAREIVEEAFAGDIIGIPNHGNIQIGDSFSEGEMLAFTGIPFFAPELFRIARIKNPLKIKQLQKGLQQLGEEGAVQVFKPMNGSDIVLGAVGVLQFDVVAHRLQAEYGVEVMFETPSTHIARWVSSENKTQLAEFEKAQMNNLSEDAAGNLTYLANHRVNLDMMKERYPDLVFHETREHAVNLSGA
jgi:peptide chain release factor 3